MNERPTGTVTFLFTDIAGSTRLWQADPAAMGRALARHNEILQSEIEIASGRIVKHTGDGVLAVFSRADSAVIAAAAVQRRLAEPTGPGLPAIRVRMALDTGEADERDGDYYGPVLNRTARLLEVGELQGGGSPAQDRGEPTDDQPQHQRHSGPGSDSGPSAAGSGGPW